MRNTCISGGANKTFPTLTSHISNNRPTIPFKIGSLIVQYVLHEHAKLHYYLLRIAFLLSIIVFHVKNCNIKTTVNHDHFDFSDAITFTIFFRMYNPRISFCGIISYVGMYGTPKKLFGSKMVQGSDWLLYEMTSSCQILYVLQKLGINWFCISTTFSHLLQFAVRWRCD